jgi:hypothetical protein
MDLIKVYPSGRVTATQRRKDYSPKRIDTQYPTLTDEGEFLLGQVKGSGIEKVLQDVESRKPLGSSNLSNLHREKTIPRGRHGITSKGRRTLVEGCTLLQEMYGRDRLSFLTLTLPDRSSACSSTEWTYAVKLLRQSLVKELKKHNLPAHLIGCVEIQPKRFERDGGLPLHLHIVMVGRHRNGAWLICPEVFTRLWHNAIDVATGINTEDIEWNAAANVQRVKKSASGYIGKYVSKGSKEVAKVIASGQGESLPHHWYVCTRNLLILIKKATFLLAGEQASNFFDYLMDNIEKTLCFHKWVEIQMSEGFKAKVAWYGQLKVSLGSILCEIAA